MKEKVGDVAIPAFGVHPIGSDALRRLMMSAMQLCNDAKDVQNGLKSAAGSHGYADVVVMAAAMHGGAAAEGRGSRKAGGLRETYSDLYGRFVKFVTQRGGVRFQEEVMGQELRIHLIVETLA